MRAGCLDALLSCSCVLLPVADGGDGTVDVLAAAGAGRVTAWVTGPLGTRVQAAYAVQERTAYIEVAQACSLRHVDAPTSHSARTATTYGVGELVRAALDDGYRHLVLVSAVVPPPTGAPGWRGLSGHACWTNGVNRCLPAASPCNSWRTST